MKKLSSVLMMTCLVMAVIFTSCSNNDEEKNVDVVGTWKISKLMTNGKDVTSLIKGIPQSMGNIAAVLEIKATFSPDGKLTLVPPVVDGEADQPIIVNYALVGNEIVLSFPATELAANNDMMMYYSILKTQGFKITVDGSIIHSGMSDFNLKMMVDTATKDMDAAQKAVMNIMLEQFFGKDLTKVTIDVQWTKE